MLLELYFQLKPYEANRTINQYYNKYAKTQLAYLKTIDAMDVCKMLD